MQTRTQQKIVGNPGSPEGGGIRARVLEALDGSGGELHELDYEDVTLSSRALAMVRSAATQLLRRFSSVEDGEVPVSRALAIFLDHVFWEEKTGGLILCADFPDQSVCLPIPSGWWGIREHAGRVQ